MVTNPILRETILTLYIYNKQYQFTMEKDKYKYVWLDAKINEGKNPQQLQIFKFIGLPELIGYAAISQLKSFVKTVGEDEKLFIICSSGMIKELISSKVLQKKNVFDKIVVFCMNQQKAIQCKKQYPKVVNGAETSDNGIVGEVRNLQVELKKELGLKEAQLQKLQENLKAKYKQQRQGSNLNNQSQLNDRNEDKNEKKQKNKKKEEKKQEKKEEKKVEKKEKKKQQKKIQKEQIKTPQEPKKTQKSQEPPREAFIEGGPIKTGEEDSEQEEETKKEEISHKRINGIYIDQKLNSMKHNLKAFQKMVDFQLFDNFGDGHSFITDKIDESPQKQYALIFTNNTSQDILNASQYPYANVLQYALFCKNQSVAHQILRKNGVQDQIPIISSLETLADYINDLHQKSLAE